MKSIIIVGVILNKYLLQEIGQKFNEARLRQRLTLEQVSVSTKISINYIQCLEKGDFSKLPGKFYEKSFIKIYAKTLKLDPSQLIKIYDEYISSSKKNPAASMESLSFKNKFASVFFTVLCIFSISFIVFSNLKEDSNEVLDQLATIPPKKNIEIQKIEEFANQIDTIEK